MPQYNHFFSRMRPILVLDFGSQFAHLIANRIRRLSAFSEIVPVTTSAADIVAMNPAGIILSGGPQSVFDPDSPQPDAKIFDLNIPFLGICYGHQLLAKYFGGNISAEQKEFGGAIFSHTGHNFFAGIPLRSPVWMNHGDSVTDLPDTFEIIGHTSDCRIAAFAHKKRPIVSVQFHPEVTHSEYGMRVLENFVSLCGTAGNWNPKKMIDEILEKVVKIAKKKNVFLLVSGGVDSSVAFALLTTALGADRVFGLFVNNGLLRKNEVAEVTNMLTDAGFGNLHIAEESEYFLQQLAGVVDPEKKRLLIGNAFLEVKRKWAQKLHLNEEEWLLGQGTIYPDHIETGGTDHASKIKTHHNRVPEIEALLAAGKIVEPLADFYKDEVRQIGLQLGLPEKMISRHPFPGPGLGVRLLCQKEENVLPHTEKVEAEIQSVFGVEAQILPVQSVGVQGDARSYRHPVALFSTKRDIFRLATDIPNHFSDINRVLLCLSHPKKQLFFSLKNAFVDENRRTLLQEADAEIARILFQKNLRRSVWQFPVVLCPVGITPQTESIILRPIQSENAMTATPVLFSETVLQEMTASLLAISGISAVFLDITSKPPGTIEWE